MPLLCRYLPVAIRRKLVHKTIGCCVIGLTHVPHCPGHGRKQHEEIQLYIIHGLVQVVSAGDFWRQHLDEFGVSFFQDEVVPRHSGTV